MDHLDQMVFQKPLFHLAQPQLKINKSQITKVFQVAFAADEPFDFDPYERSVIVLFELVHHEDFLLNSQPSPPTVPLRMFSPCSHRRD